MIGIGEWITVLTRASVVALTTLLVGSSCQREAAARRMIAVRDCYCGKNAAFGGLAYRYSVTDSPAPAERGVARGEMWRIEKGDTVLATNSYTGLLKIRLDNGVECFAQPRLFVATPAKR